MKKPDPNLVQQLIADLRAIRRDLLNLEDESAGLLDGLSETAASSARNLFHYLALRRHDVRGLQERLASLGLSSLGRAEPCVLSNLDSVLGILHHLGQRIWELPEPKTSPIIFSGGMKLLEKNTQALLGARPAHRAVRIMVTMPTEAADNYRLVHDLLDAGMDCMRINCAHDDAETWSGMIANLRRAESELGKKCRVLMDLPGPKLRTGALEPGPKVIKWRPSRDCLGRVLAPARIWLYPEGERLPPPGPASASLPLPGAWLAGVAFHDRVEFRDTRGAKRSLTTVEKAGQGCWAESLQTAYVGTGTTFRLVSEKVNFAGLREANVGELPPVQLPLVLREGDPLILTREPRPGRPAQFDSQGRLEQPAVIACTLPEVFRDIRPGEKIWFDDGKIGGVVEQASPEQLSIRIMHAKPQGEKLAGDKGINLPDTNLRLPPLTEQDLHALDFIAAHADIVGQSFVRHATDVRELQARLAERGGDRLGIILKIETRRAFEQLPQVLLAALQSPAVGVMIARGDLAVECGYERLAELQEEILWICEAAHVPVIWATQVLENLAKEGLPSRAEITDAAMGERAECVMLNKGPHILQAIRVLDNILRRMEAHQNKKRSMLRPLKLADAFPSRSAAATNR